ncbi:MAG: DUF739 family protein [Acutalibacteraceae bacterium]|nr:DUF739 family protein [Acutalibacteraceae bacterium]
MYNDKILKGKIVEKGKSRSDMASVLGIDISTLSKKLNGTTEWKRSEMQIIRNYLGLTLEESESIFFAEELAFTQDTTD